MHALLTYRNEHALHSDYNCTRVEYSLSTLLTDGRSLLLLMLDPLGPTKLRVAMHAVAIAIMWLHVQSEPRPPRADAGVSSTSTSTHILFAESQNYQGIGCVYKNPV